MVRVHDAPPPSHLPDNELSPPSHHHCPPPPPPPSFDEPYPPTPYPHAPPPPSSYFQQPYFDGTPPPYFQQPGFPSPSHFTQCHHHHHHHHHQPEHGFRPHACPPSPPHVTQVHRSSGGGTSSHQQQQPEHESKQEIPFLEPEFLMQPTYKVYCKTDPGYHLSIRDGYVILAPRNLSDLSQHWYKDEKFSTRVKDEMGFPSFSLVNKATGQVIKHSIGAFHPVELVPYKPDHLDESVLWGESQEVNAGYTAIRMINNIPLSLDAFHGARNGTTVVLCTWNGGDNQLWKIAPYSDPGYHLSIGERPCLLHEFHKKPTFKVYCKADPGYHLSIRDGHVILAPRNLSDESQHWYKDEKFGTRVKDETGLTSFSLVNKATGQAIKHSIGACHPVELVPFPDHLDESVLWSESLKVRDGYTAAIRMINNIHLNFDAFHGTRNGTTIVLCTWNGGDNQLWKIAPY